MDKFICLLLPYIIMRLIKSVMRTGIISIDILIPGTQAILTITLSIYLSIYLYIFIYLSVSWSMEIREIQMTRPALPCDYTCFCRLYSICIRNICLIYIYRVYNNLFWIFFYLNGLLQSPKGIEFLPQTKIFWFQYLCNLMVQTFDISNLDYFIYKY